MGGWKAHDRIIQRLILLLREKNIANGQHRRQKQDVSINPPAAQSLEERVAKMVGVQRGAGPVELVPVEGDGLVQDLTGAPADDPRGQTGNSRFREQLDLNTGCHEAGETERFVGRELAMPETAYDTVPRRNAFRAETIDHKRARRWENQSRRAE